MDCFDHYPLMTIDTTDLARALESFAAAAQSACAVAAGIGCASPWAMQIADEALLMTKAMLVTGKTDTEILVLAAQSPLCFADFVAALMTTPPIPPIAQPFVPSAPAQRFVKRGFYICCVDCGMAVEWCACAKQPSPSPLSSDGESSDLSKRIRELRGRDSR